MRKILFFGAYDINARIPLVHALRNHGIDVELAGVGATPSNRATPSNGDVVTMAVGSGSVRHDLAKLPRLIRELRRERGAELVHTWDSLPGVLSMRAAAHDPGIPYTRTITGTGQSFSTGGAIGFALRRSYGTAQKLTSGHGAFTMFQNTDDHRLFVDSGWIPASQAMVIPGSGVELETFDAVKSTDRGAEMRQRFDVGDRFLVVLASRLLKAKGVTEFCEAARMCDGQMGRQTVFLIVGPHEPNARRAAVVEPFRGTEVELIYGGNCPDMPGLLSASDLMVLPTAYREGIPRVLLEAAAAEVPIIASDMPGCRDVVTDGVTGLRIPPRAARPMADAIIRLAHDPVLAKELARAARERIEHSMTLDIIAAQYADVFHRLLSDSPQPATLSVIQSASLSASSSVSSSVEESRS